jgi:hypothetical protein
VASGGEIPRGVPLALDSTMKMGHMSMQGMSPDQTAKINEMMAKRPPISTSTLVEKIESKKLAAADFEVPAGFTKKELPAGPAMGSMKMAPAAGAPSAGAPPAAH